MLRTTNVRLLTLLGSNRSTVGGLPRVATDVRSRVLFSSSKLLRPRQIVGQFTDGLRVNVNLSHWEPRARYVNGFTNQSRRNGLVWFHFIFYTSILRFGRIFVDIREYVPLISNFLMVDLVQPILPWC